MNRPSRQTSPALHVLFLAGGNGRVARLAAHWTRALAGGCLQVEAASFAGMDSTPELDGAHAGLVVAIHAPGDPAPVLVHSSGGRIDWHLEVDAGTDGPFELASPLRQRVLQLLGDLGITPMHYEVSAMRRTGFSARPALPVPLPASTRPLGIGVQARA
jgi:hypothetical protein